MKKLRREPPIAVRRQLAKEVGFGCPVEGCGSPYLMWHHFDPPWRVREHHEPEGMIAICRDHHSEADAGAFTDAQLREMKHLGRDRSKELGAKFNWMREDLVAVVGGNFYVRTPIAMRVQDMPVVWFNRDEEDRLLVNLQAPTTSGQPRMTMIDNFWMTEGSEEREIVCPPSGRLVSAKYLNGDALKVEFREIASEEDFERRFPPTPMPAELKARLEQSGTSVPDPSHRESIAHSGLTFPLAAVEITLKIAGTDIDFGPKHTSVGGSVITGSWMIDCGVGIQIGEASRPQANA
jgi:hypothetical protein